MPDPAFREHASGLLVPSDISRAREVWTRDELRLIDRATKFLQSKGVAFLFACDHDACKKDRSIERIRRPDGGLTFRCGHLDREVVKGL